MIRYWLNKEWEIKITQTYREAIRVADWLARYALYMSEEFFVFDDIPFDCNEVVRDYVRGVFLPRFVTV